MHVSKDYTASKIEQLENALAQVKQLFQAGIFNGPVTITVVGDIPGAKAHRVRDSKAEAPAAKSKAAVKHVTKARGRPKGSKNKPKSETKLAEYVKDLPELPSHAVVNGALVEVG